MPSAQFSFRLSALYWRRKETVTWSWPAWWPASPTRWPTPSRPKVEYWTGRRRCLASWQNWPETCSRLLRQQKTAEPPDSQPRHSSTLTASGHGCLLQVRLLLCAWTHEQECSCTRGDELPGTAEELLVFSSNCHTENPKQSLRKFCLNSHEALFNRLVHFLWY